MNYLTKNRVLIILSFIVITIIMMEYAKRRNQHYMKEAFNQSDICDSYLKEAIHRYPCSSQKAKRHFLDWCNSFRRRHGMFPDLPTAFSRFFRIREDYLTYDSL